MITERFEMEILRASRTRLSKILETTDREMLFTIPIGFNNNIIWQIGHCIASQQRHMYIRSGLPMRVPDDFIANFKFGSSPALWKATPKVHEVKRLLIDTVNQLEEDLQSGIFIHYTPFELPFGITVTDHVQALQAANVHEAEHTGKIMSYLRILGQRE